MPYCVICEQAVSAWLPHPNLNQRSQFMALMEAVGSDLSIYQCPACGCTDRDRHLWLYLGRIGLLERLGGAAVLHMAPERALERKFMACGLGEYVRGDLHPDRAGVQAVDVEQMPFADARFDLIVCNHVLEHVAQPERALSELRRCLRPSGVLIAQTPYSPRLKGSLEVHGEPNEAFATLFYGQRDHRRLFGSDIAQVFHAQGLQGELLSHAQLLPDVDPQVMGCNAREPLFFFSRA